MALGTLKTGSNYERSGERDATLSGVVRKVNGVRHTDIDMVQWCEVCRHPEVLMEETSAEVKYTYYIQATALALGAYAMLVRHPWRSSEWIEITLWHPTTGSLVSGFNSTRMTEAQYVALCEALHHKHLKEAHP